MGCGLIKNIFLLVEVGDAAILKLFFKARGLDLAESPLTAVSGHFGFIENSIFFLGSPTVSTPAYLMILYFAI